MNKEANKIDSIDKKDVDKLKQTDIYKLKESIKEKKDLIKGSKNIQK